MLHRGQIYSDDGNGNGQTVTVQFVNPTSTFPDDSPSTEDIAVLITTSDGQNLANEVQVDVQDDGTGDATSGVDYTFTSPQTLTFTAGSADGSVENASISILLNNGPPDVTVDLSLTNESGATIGAQSTHIVTIEFIFS